MDTTVIQAMARWPHVPAVFGWLELDRRGQWLIKGERIGNPAVVDFVSRNYASDSQGRWFFQNGPQRVFVRLHYTPFVYRVLPGADGTPALETHTGVAVGGVLEALVDEDGSLVLRTGAGVGVLSDRDLPALVPLLRDASGQPLGETALEALLGGGRPAGPALHWGLQVVPLQPVAGGTLARRFGFEPDPHPPPGAPEC